MANLLMIKTAKGQETFGNGQESLLLCAAEMCIVRALSLNYSRTYWAALYALPHSPPNCPDPYEDIYTKFVTLEEDSDYL
jgi:hypothetical protein